MTNQEAKELESKHCCCCYQAKKVNDEIYEDVMDIRSFVMDTQRMLKKLMIKEKLEEENEYKF